MEVKTKLGEIVGAEYVIDSPDALKPYSVDFSLTPPSPPNYVVQPKTTEEVQKVINLANEHKMPVIPSSSKVHSYGGTIPSQGGIILDLTRMNRILEIDEPDRKVRIEPGVTWSQIQAELSKIDGMIVSPLLPHPSRSVVTDFLEREVPLTALFEYSEPLLGLGVIWPTGEIFRTGSASVPGYPDTPSKGLNFHGPGLDFCRLFQGAQGTMGVLTWANVKYEYRPKVNKCFFIPFTEVKDAVEPIYRIQRRMIGNECFLLNRHNLALILADKWPDDFEVLKNTLPPWVVVLILTGPRRRPEEKIEYEEEALNEINTEFKGLDILPTLPGIPGIEKRLPDMLRQPWPEGETYWRLRSKGGCATIPFITVLEKTPGFIEAVSQVAARYQYPTGEIGIYIQPIDRARACHCEFTFYYSPDDQAEKDRITELYTESARVLLEMEALFTRPYGALADLVYSKTTEYAAALKKFKQVLDPNNIMCPGNLCF